MQSVVGLPPSTWSESQRGDAVGATWPEVRDRIFVSLSLSRSLYIYIRRRAFQRVSVISACLSPGSESRIPGDHVLRTRTRSRTRSWSPGLGSWMFLQGDSVAYLPGHFAPPHDSYKAHFPSQNKSLPNALRCPKSPKSDPKVTQNESRTSVWTTFVAMKRCCRQTDRQAGRQSARPPPRPPAPPPPRPPGRPLPYMKI